MKHRKADWKNAYRVVIRKWRRLSESFGQIQACSPETKYTAIKCQRQGCEDASEIYIRGFKWCEAHYLDFLHDNPENAGKFQKWLTEERFGEQPARKTVDKVEPIDLKIDVDIILKSAMMKGYRSETEAFRRYVGQRFLRSGIYNLMKRR